MPDLRSSGIQLILMTALTLSILSLTSTTLFASLCRTASSIYFNFKIISIALKIRISSNSTYLHNLLIVQPPRVTCSSSCITLFRPPCNSSLKITNLSFRIAACQLLNGLPSSHWCGNFFCPLLLSVSTAVFLSKLKTYLFQQSFPP
jgi:hypothetical protein